MILLKNQNGDVGLIGLLVALVVEKVERYVGDIVWMSVKKLKLKWKKKLVNFRRVGLEKYLELNYDFASILLIIVIYISY